MWRFALRKQRITLFFPDLWHCQAIDLSGTGKHVKTLDFWHSKANWTDRFELSINQSFLAAFSNQPLHPSNLPTDLRDSRTVLLRLMER